MKLYNIKLTKHTLDSTIYAMSESPFPRDLAEKIKKSKPFKPKDVIVYVLVAVFVALTFLTLLFFPKNDGAGFYAFIRGEKALTFYYGGECTIEEKFKSQIVFDSDKNTVTVYFNESKTDYNVISVDNENKKVRVIKSTCESHDCELMENDIYCAPHRLKITQIRASGDVTVG